MRKTIIIPPYKEPTPPPVVRLVRCPQHNATTGQDCVDKRCMICHGTGKFWQEDASVRQDFLLTAAVSLSFVNSGAQSVGAFLADLLSAAIEHELFNHGCDESPHPCRVCDDQNAKTLFKQLVELRARQLK